MAQGAFNRSVALRSPGTRMLRRGNPLVDFLAEVIAIDDRGQASAIRSVDPGFTGDPEPYFGFDYIVEADITRRPVPCRRGPGTAPALRRQADRMTAALHSEGLVRPGYWPRRGRPIQLARG